MEETVHGLGRLARWRLHVNVQRGAYLTANVSSSKTSDCDMYNKEGI